MVTATTVKPYCPSWRPSSYSWHNTWKQSFHAWCNGGFSLSHWYTYYRSCQGDRLHHFKCTRTPAYGRHPTCAWTNYLNNPRQYYFKACTNNAYIAGVLSYYDQHTSDRMYCEGREGDTKASHSPRASRPVVRRSSTRGQGRRWLWERDCYYSDVCCTLSVTRN